MNAKVKPYLLMFDSNYATSYTSSALENTWTWNLSKPIYVTEDSQMILDSLVVQQVGNNSTTCASVLVNVAGMSCLDSELQYSKKLYTYSFVAAGAGVTKTERIGGAGDTEYGTKAGLDIPKYTTMTRFQITIKRSSGNTHTFNGIASKIIIVPKCNNDEIFKRK